MTHPNARQRDGAGRYLPVAETDKERAALERERQRRWTKRRAELRAQPGPYFTCVIRDPDAYALERAAAAAAGVRVYGAFPRFTVYRP